MKAADVSVGDIVVLKCSGKIVKARIETKADAYADRGGTWTGLAHIGRKVGPRFTATNLETGRTIGPFSVGRVRGKVAP